MQISRRTSSARRMKLFIAELSLRHAIISTWAQGTEVCTHIVLKKSFVWHGSERRKYQWEKTPFPGACPAMRELAAKHSLIYMSAWQMSSKEEKSFIKKCFWSRTGKDRWKRNPGMYLCMEGNCIFVIRIQLWILKASVVVRQKNCACLLGRLFCGKNFTGIHGPYGYAFSRICLSLICLASFPGYSLRRFQCRKDEKILHGIQHLLIGQEGCFFFQHEGFGQGIWPGLLSDF